MVLSNSDQLQQICDSKLVEITVAVAVAVAVVVKVKAKAKSASNVRRFFVSGLSVSGLFCLWAFLFLDRYLLNRTVTCSLQQTRPVGFVPHH